MSPEQLQILQRLSKLFEEGLADPSQIKELSALLAEINTNQIENETLPFGSFVHSRENSDRL